MSVVKKLFRDLTSFQVSLEDWELLDQGVNILWGPSGAGKSTIINALLGLDEKADLRWSWGKSLMHELSPADRKLGVVFQEPGLFPHMNVSQNVLFPINKKSHQHWEEDYQYLIENLQLKGIEKSICNQISGGEAQRVAMARALIYRPRMLLLDEPFSSLDKKLQKQCRGMLKEVTQARGCPVLMVTHDPEDVETLANKISHLELGKIVKEERL